MRLTASRASGEIGGASLPRLVFAAMSASLKKPRRACAHHSTSLIGPGWRSGSYSRIAGERIGLQPAREAGQVPFGMLALAVSRIVEQCSRWGLAGKRTVITHIHPQPPGVGLALSQHEDWA